MSRPSISIGQVVGCKMEPCYRDKTSHAKSCKYRPVFCKYKRRGCPSALWNISQKCKSAKICPRQWNDLVTAPHELRSPHHHIRWSFGSKTANNQPQYPQCPGTQQLSFFNSARHASGCGYRPVPCSFEARGCEKRINARELEQHCESNLAMIGWWVAGEYRNTMEYHNNGIFSKFV